MAMVQCLGDFIIGICGQEDAMSIIRLIHIKVDPSETETAEHIWMTEYAPLMISQKGCISEKLLRPRKRGEFISYSEWETEADIERFTSSAAHKQVVSHMRSVKGTSAEAKLYDPITPAEVWDRRWRNPSFSPKWWLDGPHELIRTTVESGWLSPGCSILEIGCGAGQGAAWLARQGFAVTGIDISAAAINQAQSKFRGQSGLTFCVADVTARNTLDRTFDTIVDSGCLHGVPVGYQSQYLDSVLAWSHPQTKFIILVHCIHQTPADRLKQVETLFMPHFDISSHEYRADVLPRAPETTMMVIRLIRCSS
jgi:heme-degrading monooxygenase HmoA